MSDPSRRKPAAPRAPRSDAEKRPPRNRRGLGAKPLDATVEGYVLFLVDNVRFGPDDQRTLRAFHERVGPHLDRVVDDFYGMIAQMQPLRSILGTDPAVLARLRVSFRKWLDEILALPHDRRQIRKHLHIGDKHVEIGLENRFLMIAFQHVRSSLLRLADEMPVGDRGALEVSLDRIMTFEAALLTDGYSNRRMAQVLERGEAEERRFHAREVELIRQVSVAQDRFFSILQNPIALILVVDAKGQVLLFNEAAERTLGFEAAEILGEGSFLDVLVTEEDRAVVEHHLTRVLAGERVPFLQWGVRSKAGQRVELASTFFPTSDAKDSPLCAVLALDVTEQTRLREELTQAERLATIGRLVAMVAHEVGNPLAGMKGVLEIVRGRLPEDSEETALLGRVLDRTNDLAELIRDLLVMARPVEVHPVLTPMSLFLKDITSGLDPVGDLLGCSVDVVCEPERLSIPIDPGQLRRAMTNLLLNAAQAAGLDGSIRLVADVHGDAVWIDVEDSGPGITETVMRQLFTPFFTTRRGGTGLGLSIAREIVRKHGGELVPSNLLEGGARFRIVLPQGMGPRRMGDAGPGGDPEA